jgi:hypothetical protein
VSSEEVEGVGHINSSLGELEGTAEFRIVQLEVQ